MKIGDVLIDWYRNNKRALPWRETRNPYLIWISEIILQQTRVSQGLSYYLRFVKKFPDIQTLANAEIDDILKVWQGLGYYSRARNMHKAAKEVIHIYNGVFPASSSELMKLKGIGLYTSAAISSICFDEKVPVVDGNVIRLISRLKGICEPMGSEKLNKGIYSIAESFMQSHSPGEINQAMMEFGALQCVPGKAACEACPLKNNCYAYKNNRVEFLPVKKILKKQKNRYFHYFIILNKRHVILKKRIENDIWQGLYEFPLIETSSPVSVSSLLKSKEFLSMISAPDIKISKAGKNLKHVLSHQIIHSKFFKIDIPDLKDLHYKDSEIADINEITTYPVSRLIEKFIEKEWKNFVSLKR